MRMKHVRRAVAAAFLCCVSVAGAGQDSRTDLKRELARLWAEQRYEDLLARVEPHLSDARDAAELWIMAAEAALKSEDFPRAVASFERGLKIDARLGGAAINLGFAYLKVDRTSDARAVFEGFLRDSSKPRAAKAQYGLGLVLTAEGRADEARTAF